MIKRIIIIILFLPVLACTKKDQFVIRGFIEEAEPEKIYLDEQDVEKTQTIDSTRIDKKGQFALKGHTEFPKFYNLHLGNHKILPLLVGPGEEISIRSTNKDFPYQYEIEGSEGSKHIKYLNDHLYSTGKKLDSIRNLIEDTPVSEETRQSELINEYSRVLENQRNFTIKFILDHLTSMASIYAIYQKLNEETFVLFKKRDIQLFKITGAALDTIYPESGHVRSLVTNAANLEQQIRSEQLQMLFDEAEESIPEIALPNPDGDTILLSSLKGKVVLLSFWASWNKESTDFNLQLLDLYNRYHRDGFEIYQVSLDFERESWIRAIEFDELPWISVCGFNDPESKVAAIYNVTSLPTTYLLNREGVITGKDLSLPDLSRRINFLINE